MNFKLIEAWRCNSFFFLNTISLIDTQLDLGVNLLVCSLFGRLVNEMFLSICPDMHTDKTKPMLFRINDYNGTIIE